MRHELNLQSQRGQKSTHVKSPVSRKGFLSRFEEHWPDWVRNVKESPPPDCDPFAGAAIHGQAPEIWLFGDSYRGQLECVICKSSASAIKLDDSSYFSASLRTFMRTTRRMDALLTYRTIEDEYSLARSPFRALDPMFATEVKVLRDLRLAALRL